METAEGPHLAELGPAAQGASEPQGPSSQDSLSFNAAQVSNNHPQL